MSAWLCSENHIGMLAAYLARHKQSGHELFNAREFAKTFARENLRSLNARYGDDPNDEIYVENCMDRAEHYLFHLPDRKPVFWIKQFNCYEYQSCESDDWMDTLACRLCRESISHAVRELPGYENEPWGVN